MDEIERYTSEEIHNFIRSTVDTADSIVENARIALNEVIKARTPKIAEEIFEGDSPKPLDRKGIEDIAKILLTKHCKILEYNEAQKSKAWSGWHEALPEELKKWIDTKEHDIFFIEDASPRATDEGEPKPTFIFFSNRQSTCLELRGKAFKNLLRREIKQAEGNDKLSTTLLEISREYGPKTAYFQAAKALAMDWSDANIDIASKSMIKIITDCLNEIHRECLDKSEQNQIYKIDALTKSFKNKFTQKLLQQGSLYFTFGILNKVRDKVASTPSSLLYVDTLFSLLPEILLNHFKTRDPQAQADKKIINILDNAIALRDKLEANKASEQSKLEFLGNFLEKFPELHEQLAQQLKAEHEDDQTLSISRPLPLIRHLPKYSKTLLLIDEKAKTFPEQVRESLSRSTTALLSDFTPQNATLLEAIIPIYTELATLHRSVDISKKSNAETLKNIQEMAEKIFTPKPASETTKAPETTKISERYAGFKRECKEKRSHLNAKSDFTEKVTLCLRRISEFLLFFVGLAPEVRSISFFQTSSQRRFNQLDRMIEPLRQKEMTDNIVKEETTPTKATPSSAAA